MANIKINGTEYQVPEEVAELLYMVSKERDDLAGVIAMYKKDTGREGITCH